MKDHLLMSRYVYENPRRYMKNGLLDILNIKKASLRTIYMDVGISLFTNVVRDPDDLDLTRGYQTLKRVLTTISDAINAVSLVLF